MRAIRWAAAGVVVIALLGTGLLFVWPPLSSAPRHADAVVMLSGGAGDRLTRALQLMRRGVAPVLVIPNGDDPRWKAVRPVCDTPQPFTVLCLHLPLNSTRGEARLLRQLFKERGWHSVAIVTSRFHVSRARLLVHRCIGGRFRMVASNRHDSFFARVGHVVHEWTGFTYAALIRRGC